MTYLQVFLKVCEGCGILWFRAQNSIDVYCPACAQRMRSLPPVRPSRRHPRRGRPASARTSSSVRCNGGAA
jgi:uncharacterized Zn finger protein (UPF0148 family)